MHFFIGEEVYFEEEGHKSSETEADKYERKGSSLIGCREVCRDILQFLHMLNLQSNGQLLGSSLSRL